MPLNIGDKIRYFREIKGLTLDGLAEISKINRDHIGRLERNEAINPGLETLTAIARALDVPLGGIIDFGEGLQDSVRPKGAEDAPKYIPHDIPEVGLVQAGRGGFFDPEGHPMGGWPRKFHRPEDVTDPNAYVVRVEGDSMEPFLKKGHRLMCVTNQEAVPGDMVVVQLKNDEFMVKELTLKDGMIILKSLNPLHEPIVLNKKEVRAIHPVVWIKRK